MHLRGRPPRPLTDQEEKRARAVVNPTIILRSRSIEQLPLFHEPEVAPEDMIRAMDRKQERLAEHLHWGYRVIRGVAGSGKTLILVSRARYLHRHWPRLRILVVTFNRVLASALETWTVGSDVTGSGEGALLVRNVDRLPFYMARSFQGETLAEGGDTEANDTRVQQAVDMAQRVHVPDVDEEDQFQAAKSQLYAAMTRAMDELEITMSGGGPIGAALLEAERQQRPG